LQGIQEPEPKYYRPKSYFITARVDELTYNLLEETAFQLGKKKSSLIRLAIFVLVIITDPRVTVQTFLKKEAIEKLKRGEDMPLIDAIRDMRELLSELGFMD
jgi:hypothetical protein